ncbi:hypothetical protein, partial [Vreelandella gomseomensis]
HDKTECAVTIIQNRRSRSNGMGGHDRGEYAHRQSISRFVKVTAAIYMQRAVFCCLLAPLCMVAAGLVTNSTMRMACVSSGFRPVDQGFSHARHNQPLHDQQQ